MHMMFENRLLHMTEAVFVSVKSPTALTRADQNTGGAFLEFSMRTAMHGTSHVLSAISVCHNQKRFTIYCQ